MLCQIKQHVPPDFCIIPSGSIAHLNLRYFVRSFVHAAQHLKYVVSEFIGGRFSNRASSSNNVPLIMRL